MAKLDIEKAIIAVFCCIFLWFSATSILDHQINHSFPYGYFASDAFQNYGIAEGIKESGNYLYQPFPVAGGYKDVVGTHYPIIYHLTVLLSNTAGIETYNSLVFLVILFLLWISLTAYLLIRRYNTKVAILALPFMMLVTYNKFSISITFGQHGIITGSLFMVAFMWALARFDIEEIPFLAIFLSASMLGHGPEFVFAGIFFAVYLILRFLYKEFKIPDIKKIFFVGILSLIISFYYFLILRFAWAAHEFGQLEFVTLAKFMEGRAFPPVIFHQDFHVLILILIYAGLAISSVLFFQKKDTTILAFLFLIFLGFSNYTGFGHKGFQQRTLWPVYISFFAGLAIYFALKFVLKKSLIYYTAIIFLILSATFVFAYSGKTKPGSMMDPYHWDSFVWIQKNIPKNSTVYFFYQDITSQHSLYYASTQRTSYVIDLDGFIEAIKSKKIKRFYRMSVSAEIGAKLPYRKNLFSYRYHALESTEMFGSDYDICNMEYIVYDKLSSQQVLAGYNMLIMNQIKNNTWFQEVYPNNPVVSILKNNKPGEKCIDEQQFA